MVQACQPLHKISIGRWRVYERFFGLPGAVRAVTALMSTTRLGNGGTAVSRGNNSGIGNSKAGRGIDPPHRSDRWVPCGLAARIASSDRNISTAARIVRISREGAKVEVMFPVKGPPAIMLFDCENDEIYECEVRWRTDAYVGFIGVRFLDILGSGRRRLFFADQPVPLRRLPNAIIRLNEPPRDDGPSSLFDPTWRREHAESSSLRNSPAARSTQGPREADRTSRRANLAS
jgi:hypothetical protein